jgi:hypothetical protein
MTLPINSYRGDSIPRAKVVNIAPVSVVAGQIFTVWCNGKSVSYTALVSDGISGVVAGLLTALLAVSTIPEFTEFTPSAATNGLSLNLTAVTPGVPFDVAVTSSGNMTVVETTAGHGGQNEIQKVALVGAYTGGTFTLTWNFGAGNVTTGTIAYNATAAAVQTAVAALTGVGAGNVVVTGPNGGPWFVNFTGTLANTAIAVGTLNGSGLTGGSTVVITETQKGNGLSDAVQMIDLTVINSGGFINFTLTFGGQTTAALGFWSTPAQVQTALQGLSSIGAGNALVYGQGPPDGGGGYMPSQYWFVHFTGALAGTNVPTLALDATTVGMGGLVTTTQTGGQTSSNDIQIVDVTGGSTATAWSGTFTLTYAGVTTAPFAINNTVNLAGAVQTALAGIAAIGAGNVTVTPLAESFTAPLIGPNALLVKFTGALANTQCQLLTCNNSGVSGSPPAATVTRVSVGKANCNEIQTIAVVATGGTFTLTLGAQTTAAIAWNASTGTLQTRIQTDLNTTVTACTVTGSGTLAAPWVVTVTTPANTPIALMTANSASLTGGSGTVTELQAGSAGVNEVQTVTAAAGVSGGTFTLTFNGATTIPINWNATAAQVQAALRALSTINTVTAAGSAGGPWTVTWSGAQANTQEPLMFGDGSLLTGATSSLVTMFTPVWSAGPNHFDDPNNWTLGHVPNTLEPVVFDLGSSDCLYGLNQIAVVTANAATDTVTWALLAGGSQGNGSTAGSFIAGQAVYFTNAGGGLPAPLAAGTLYYLVNVNRDAGTAQLAATLGGTPIDITTAGTGTQTMGVRALSIEETERFGGAIGLPRQNNKGYVEYRPRYLHIGLATIAQTGLQTVTIGTDQGSGAGKTQIDTDVDATFWTVYGSGGSFDTEAHDIMFKGTNTSNTLNQINGDVALALFEGETTNVASIQLRGGTLELGPGLTLTGPLNKTSGTLICDGCTLNGTVTL